MPLLLRFLIAFILVTSLLGAVLYVDRFYEVVEEDMYLERFNGTWPPPPDPLAKELNSYLEDGWVIDDLYGDSCGCIYIQLKRKIWRIK